MINEDKFNLFFATGSKQYLEMLLTCNVKRILISYAYPDPWALKPLLKRNKVSLLCDSGAFTSWNLANKKKRAGDPNWEKSLVNLDKYIEFVKKHSDIIYRAVNLDVIPGEQGSTPTQEQIIEAAEQGWANYQYMKKNGINSVHVFHFGEPMEYLDRMLKECDYIGISPSNDLADVMKMKWLDLIFRYIGNSSNPKIKTHGFGVTSKKLVERYPWFSCDSASYSLTSAMGGVLTPWGRYYVSDQNQGDPDHILTKPMQVQEELDRYFMEHVGYGIKHMTSNKEEKEHICTNCHHKSLRMEKEVSYKPRNYANIVYFLKLEERVHLNGPTLDYLKQQVLF